MPSGVASNRFNVHRRWIIGAWVAVCAAVGSPSDVRASCGDYLHVGINTVTSGAADEGASTAGLPAPERPRCHGPECRSGHETPPAPSSPTLTVTVHHWACCCVRTAPIPPQSALGADQTHATFATLAGASIYRPPRVAE